MRAPDGPAASRDRPASLLLTPEHFGRERAGEWRVPAPDGRGALAAAYYQHLVACAVSDEVRLESACSTAELAAVLGTTTDQLRRKLAGHRPMSLTEVLRLALHLGVQILPDPIRREDLLPPTS